MKPVTRSWIPNRVAFRITCGEGGSSFHAPRSKPHSQTSRISIRMSGEVLGKVHWNWTYIGAIEPRGREHRGAAQSNTWRSLTSPPSWGPWASHFPFLGLSFLILDKGRQHESSAPLLCFSRSRPLLPALHSYSDHWVKR